MPLHPFLADLASSLDAARTSPWAAPVLVALAMIGGLVLWGLGRKVIRPIMMLQFAAIGGALGLFVIPSTPIADSVGTVGGVVIGLAAGAIAGALLYRIAMAAGFALVSGAAATLAAVVLMSATGALAGTPTGGLSDSYTRNADRYNELVHNLRNTAADPDLTGDDDASRAQAAQSAATAAGHQLRDFFGSAGADATAAWSQLAPRDRVILGLVAVFGAAVGLLVGLAMPSWAAGLATAMVGAGIWLPAGVWLIRTLGAPGADQLALVSPRGWLTAWAAAALVGMIIQTAGERRRGALPRAQPA